MPLKSIKEKSGDICVTLPERNIEVCLRLPLLKDLFDIDSSEVVGSFEQSILLLKNIITKYGSSDKATLNDLYDLSLEDVSLLNQSYVTPNADLNYDIVELDDREGIAFNLSDGTEVVMVRPNTLCLIEVERESKRNYSDAGELTYTALLIARCIVKFGDKEGNKCVKLNDILPLSLNDWGLIAAASSIFFRSKGGDK